MYGAAGSVLPEGGRVRRAVLFDGVSRSVCAGNAQKLCEAPLLFRPQTKGRGTGCRLVAFGGQGLYTLNGGFSGYEKLGYKSPDTELQILRYRGAVTAERRSAPQSTSGDR